MGFPSYPMKNTNSRTVKAIVSYGLCVVLDFWKKKKKKNQGPVCKFLLSSWKSQAVPLVQFGELQRQHLMHYLD